MAKNKNGALAAVAFQARHKVGAYRVQSEDLCRNALRIKNFLQLLGRFSLIPRRIARIHPQYAREVIECLIPDRTPVGLSGNAIDREKQKQKNS